MNTQPNVAASSGSSPSPCSAISSVEALRHAIKAVLNTTLAGWKRRVKDLSDMIEENDSDMGIMADAEEQENLRGCRDAIIDCIADIEKVTGILNK